MDKMTSENVNGEHSVDPVHSVEKPLPNSRRVYVGGELHSDVRVPFFVIPSEVEGSLDISVRL
jgi:hypothetical protein